MTLRVALGTVGSFSVSTHWREWAGFWGFPSVLQNIPEFQGEDWASQPVSNRGYLGLKQPGRVNTRSPLGLGRSEHGPESTCIGQGGEVGAGNLQLCRWAKLGSFNPPPLICCASELKFFGKFRLPHLLGIKIS